MKDVYGSLMEKANKNQKRLVEDLADYLASEYNSSLDDFVNHELPYEVDEEWFFQAILDTDRDMKSVVDGIYQDDIYSHQRKCNIRNTIC